MNKTELSAVLKSRRTASGLTQNDVAKKLGYSSPQFVSNWERGLSCPPVSAISRLSGLYKVSEKELFELILEATVNRVEQSLRTEFKTVRARRRH